MNFDVNIYSNYLSFNSADAAPLSKYKVATLLLIKLKIGIVSNTALATKEGKWYEDINDQISSSPVWFETIVGALSYQVAVVGFD